MRRFDLAARLRRGENQEPPDPVQIRLLRAICIPLCAKTATALINEMNLSNINFMDDGAVELWYEGSKAFNCLDVNINLNADLLPIEVRFDG